jgi:hypothetical protein
MLKKKKKSFWTLSILKKYKTKMASHFADDGVMTRCLSDASRH